MSEYRGRGGARGFLLASTCASLHQALSKSTVSRALDRLHDVKCAERDRRESPPSPPGERIVSPSEVAGSVGMHRELFLNMVPLVVQSAERHRSVEPAALLAAPVFPLLSPLCL